MSERHEINMRFDWGTCRFVITVAKESLARVKAMLNPNNAMHAGCRVERHPAACALCVANNDCARLPMHINCRCKQVPYLTAAEI